MTTEPGFADLVLDAGKNRSVRSYYKLTTLFIHHHAFVKILKSS